MSREYRLVLNDLTAVDEALRLLRRLPTVELPSLPHQTGELWLRPPSSRLPYEVRVVVKKEYGFFVEVTKLSDSVRHTLRDWVESLSATGGATVVDEDTEEAVQPWAD
jgi:hypothetical protein